MRWAAWLLAVGVLVSGCAGGGGGGDGSPSPTTMTTTTTAAPATPSGPSPAQNSFKFTEIISGLGDLVYVTHAGDGSGRLFVVEQVGKIHIWKNGVVNPTPFLDITGLVASGGERGLLSVAFYPDYETSGRFIVDYTRASQTAGENGDTVVARYKASPANSDLADPTTAEVLLVIDQPQSNHNGGLVKFGPDGMLYIGSGDGGGADDDDAGHDPVVGNGQSLNTLLGKMLRIDVSRPGAYQIPTDNPDLGSSAKKEIWAYGLRNPWRFSFDRATGDLYIADVGQQLWEEVNHQAKSSRGGENYGWKVWEGNHLWRPGTAVTGDTKPVAEYSIVGEHCSVTGGYVYRGSKIPALSGFYVVADYCSGNMWTLAKVGGTWTFTDLMDTSYMPSSFGEDEAGELYLVHHRGKVYRFDPV